MSRPWPLLGDLPAFHFDSTGFLRRIAEEQGDVARFRLGRTEAFLLSHPDQVQEVLVDRASHFTKGRLMQRARRLLGDGLLTSEGETHRLQRRRIQPAFAREQVQACAACVPQLAERRLAAWRAGGRVRVDIAMDALTMGIVAKALLGVDIEAEVPALGRALRRLARWAPLLAAPGGEVIENVRLPMLGSLGDALQTVEAAVNRQIAEGSTGAPLLSALLHASDQGPLSPAQVRDQVMTIFLAGHDTTAAALTWIWLLLAAHPDVESRLREEVSAVVQDGTPRIEDLASLPLTQMVVKETLRLYPPIGRIGRRPLEQIDLGVAVLPRNAAVFLSPFVTQRDPRWFDDPDSFTPERWSRPADERPRFAWFPFGAGPRSCIGEHFGRTVLTLAVATIARRWRLKPSRPGLPRSRSLLTLKPKGPVWMIAQQVPSE